MASQKKNSSKRNTMYYRKPDDRELVRDSDVGEEDSSDPMNSDGYGEEQEEGGWMGEPMFEVPTKPTQKDDLAPGLMVRLRKRGIPGGK